LPLLNPKNQFRILFFSETFSQHPLFPVPDYFTLFFPHEFPPRCTRELNKTLATFLSEVTDRVIAQGIESNMAEVDVAPGRLPAGAGGA
jgi:hypothetical protein